MTTDAWGLDDHYVDALETRRTTSAATRAAIHRIMGVELDGQPHSHAVGRSDSKAAELPPVIVVSPHRPAVQSLRGELRLEQGGTRVLDGPLPANLPLGYHNIFVDRGRPVRLIVSPGRCYLPADLKIWGWAVQLYAARSRASWGIGDLGDLAQLGHWARRGGASLLLTNPLDAVAPVLPQESSPYYPTSRRFGNPLYLRIEEIPGFDQLSSTLGPLAEAGRALNGAPLIDRDKIFELKFAALGQLWKKFSGDAACDAFMTERGASLSEFATYCTLSEKFGSNWREWPADYRTPHSPGVAPFAAQHADRVRFFAWLQWLLDRQMATAAAALPIMQDLPIGANPSGADTWSWQHLLADGAAVGAPPDVFNTLGQNWGLTPWVPHKLRAAQYGPFVEVVRSALRHAGGLRIDHVLGLFRLFWIPDGMPASAGAYVRYPAEDLLDIVALESHRARAIVVGEDLGTVEDGVRETLADHNMLSYALLWFEEHLPAQYARKALAAITTHDLPTVAGLWSGSDLAEQHALKLAPNDEAAAGLRARLAELGQLKPTATAAEAVLAVHRALAEAPSVLLAATLEDALVVERRPNIPNTLGGQRPNWSLPLPVPIDDLDKVPLAAQLAAVLSARVAGESDA